MLRAKLEKMRKNTSKKKRTALKKRCDEFYGTFRILGCLSAERSKLWVTLMTCIDCGRFGVFYSMGLVTFVRRM
jgi:hypothetical protein